jgi:hypothetical protein
MPEPVVYRPADRPDVEIEIDGTWYPGELRAWFPRDDGTWEGNVMYSLGPAQNHLDQFPRSGSGGSDPPGGVQSFRASRRPTLTPIPMMATSRNPVPSETMMVVTTVAVP